MLVLEDAIAPGEAVEGVSGRLAVEGLRCTVPVDIANGWLPAGK